MKLKSSFTGFKPKKSLETFDSFIPSRKVPNVYYLDTLET